jgi:hypothetical protein
MDHDEGKPLARDFVINLNAVGGAVGHRFIKEVPIVPSVPAVPIVQLGAAATLSSGTTETFLLTSWNH